MPGRQGPALAEPALERSRCDGTAGTGGIPRNLLQAFQFDLPRGDSPQGFGEQEVLLFQDARRQGFRGVPGQHRDPDLGEDRAVVVELVDEVHGGPGLGIAGGEHRLVHTPCRRTRGPRTSAAAPGGC